tara:strand:+ start:2822 stop:3283 length:462 start_codon:yes stop_codon:yes gene_type:complete
MKFFIITICNKNEDYDKFLTQKYSDLIKKFYTIEFININFKTKKINKNVYKKEYDKALTLIKPNSILVALDEQGEHFKTVEFSKKLNLWIENTSQIYFIIGGPDGLSDDVKKRADYVISLSNLTFPHQLAKVILLEQIYRSICIMNNHPYHRS